MTGADIATTADLAAIDARLAKIEKHLAAIAALAPTPWRPIRDVAHSMGIDWRTVQAMPGVRIQRAGRRLMVDVRSLRGVDDAEIAKLAAGARG